MSMDSQLTAETKSDNIRVFIADDHHIVRHGLVLTIQREFGMEVVGEASLGCEAVEGVRKLNPDVVLMDFKLPDISGIDAARQILATNPEVSVLILSAYIQDSLLPLALKAGVSGYILKGMKIETLVSAIWMVNAGEVFITPGMASGLIADHIKIAPEDYDPDTRERLSVRERALLPLLAEGRTRDEIGELFHLSPYTIQTHRQRIMRKLDLHNQAELMKYALRKNLITIEP